MGQLINGWKIITCNILNYLGCRDCIEVEKNDAVKDKHYFYVSQESRAVFHDRSYNR